MGEALDLEFVHVDREQAAGKFSINLVEQDGHGRQLIIESQLERSDHDHLGKLITYLTASVPMARWAFKTASFNHLGKPGGSYA